jgi:TonB family protein
MSAFRRCLILCLAAAGPVSAGGREDFDAAYGRYRELAAEERYAEALPFARRAHDLGMSLYGRQHRNTAALAFNLGKSLRHGGEAAEAVKVLRSALSDFERLYGKNAIELVDPLVELGNALAQQADGISPRRHYTRALQLVERHAGRNSKLYGDVALEAGATLLFSRHAGESPVFLENARSAYFGAGAPGEAGGGAAALYLGKYHLQAGDAEKAGPFLKEALLIAERAGDAAGSLLEVTHTLLVAVHSELGNEEGATAHSLAVARLLPADASAADRLLYSPSPEYPRQARRLHRSGSAIIAFTVDESGRVRDPVVVGADGGEGFEQAALNAIRRFRYAPRLVNGEPIPAEGVEFRFQFEGGERPALRTCQKFVTRRFLFAGAYNQYIQHPCLP